MDLGTCWQSGAWANGSWVEGAWCPEAACVPESIGECWDAVWCQGVWQSNVWCPTTPIPPTPVRRIGGGIQQGVMIDGRRRKKLREDEEILILS